MKLNRNQLIFFLTDGLCAMLSWYMATFLRFDGQIPESHLATLPVLMALAAGLAIVSGLFCGTYAGLWNYMGFAELFRQAFSTFFMGVGFLIVKAVDGVFVSGSITVIACGIYLLLSVLLRGLPRMATWFAVQRRRRSGSGMPVLIVGAGNAAALIIHRLQEDTAEEMYPVAAVDDDQAKLGRKIVGVPIAGAIADVEIVCKKYRVQQIVIAIPTATEAQLNTIYDHCSATRLPVKIFPRITDFNRLPGKTRLGLKEVSIEDLLFRDSVKPDMTAVYTFLKGKHVMVTGGVGSIGSELCRQVLEHGCGRLVIFDIHENGLFALDAELRGRFDPSRYSLCVGSVRDQARLDEVMEQYRPEVVIHAAAHKHVPMMEANPGEAVKNNVFGTRNVINACAAHGVRRFILISTDKAVNPTNVMGATKRVAELLVQSMNGRGGCEMAAVRFGNVLGSSGSVIPTFQRQIAAGGPVTVTHKDMRRYFMTIPEAVSLVLSAGTLAKGGEIFVLDMGKPIRIYDLAKSMIKLSGYVPDKDIQIDVVGLRPGEKLFEELSLDTESVDKTSHSKIFVMHRTSWDMEAFAAQLDALEEGLKAPSFRGEDRERLFRMIQNQ